ncbi:MAG: tyrosine-type recombinase/integrase [Anaerolineaceae bacterium]|jgi:site-specific recombinase XerD|nr:tyrosine-type recombinase/integrase [Anaerolineaceae bacterium]
MLSLDIAIKNYLRTISLARSENTHRTYQNGLNVFKNCLQKVPIDIEDVSTDQLTEKHFALFINELKTYSPTTERLYITAVVGFIEYLVSENLSNINIQSVRMLVKTRARIPRQRLPQFPKLDIETLLDQISNINLMPAENVTETLINFRDKAFLICLADTGLRVHEACNLRRGDVDWFEKKAIVVGKGNREAIVRFSDRSISAIKDYLKVRSTIDGSTGVPLTSLPLFARHDKGAGKKIKPITTTTGRNIVSQRVEQYLGEEALGTITPHSFRHYYVTRVLQSSGNLKLAQSLARHTNIAITQRYAHINDDELDKGYNEIFDQ